jgi:hypothetical protein
MSKPTQLDRAIANLDEKIAAAEQEVAALRLAREHVWRQREDQKIAAAAAKAARP